MGMEEVDEMRCHVVSVYHLQEHKLMRPIRLILYVAVFAVLATLTQMCPRTLLTVGLLVGQFVPSLAVCAFFTYLCQRRTTALWLMASGTFLGFLLAPSIESIRENQIWLDDFLDNRISCAEYTGIGTLVAGSAIYLIERVRRLK